MCELIESKRLWRAKHANIRTAIRLYVYPSIEVPVNTTVAGRSTIKSFEGGGGGGGEFVDRSKRSELSVNSPPVPTVT